MRILFTTFTFWPQRNGIANAVGAVAFRLASRGHKVTVATGFEPERKVLNEQGVEIQRFEINHLGGESEELARYRQYLIEHGNDFDIIICHSWDTWSTNLAESVYPRLKSKKVFVSHGFFKHEFIPFPRFPWGLWNWMRGLWFSARAFRYLRWFDKFVFLSLRRDKDRFIDHAVVSLLKPQAISVIPNGVDSAFLEVAPRDLREEWSAAPGECVFLALSEYSDLKNQKFALRAFRRSKAPGLLVFVGQKRNSYSDELLAEALAQEAHYPQQRILILEDRGGDFVRRCYAACDIFVLSSRYETQPLTILQAMAAGRPFISSHVGCVCELEGGSVVRTEAEMADRMLELGENRELRERLGAAGHEAAMRDHQWEEVASKFEELCAQLITSSVALYRSSK